MMASISKPARRLGWKKTVLFVATVLIAGLALIPSAPVAAVSDSLYTRASSSATPMIVAQCYPASQCGPSPTPTPPGPSPTPTPTPTPAAPPDCSASGSLSWALCPLTELIVNATTFIETNLILPYLTVSPLSTDAASPVFKLWSTVRNIANILFIIVFFFVIFSQATSVGLSNYGVKRMLPRLVWVAIVANLSYYLVAFAIDAFNIFGAGVAQLVMGILSTGGASSGQGTNVNGFWQIAIPLTVLGVGVSMGWIWSLLGAILLIILIAVIVLVLRQMLILLLVVLSPLLAIAELLPNTEKYAEKGWSALFKLLLMYPLIVFIFAIGNIVGALLSSGDIQLANGQAASKEVSDIIKQVFVALAKASPLLLIPATFAAAGQVLGNAHNLVRQQSQNLSNRGRQAYQNSSFGKYRQQQEQQREQQIASGNYVARSNWSKYNPGHYVNMARSRVNRGLNRSAMINTATGGFGAQQTLQNESQRREARGATQKYFNDDYQLAEAWLRSGGDEKKAFTMDGMVGNVARQNTFRQMANSGLNRSGDSYIAAMELAANSGRGDQKMATDTFKLIRALNPATGENDVATLATNMRVAYRKTGRGDLAGDYVYNAATRTGTSSIENFTPINKSKTGVTPESAWSDVSFEHLSRHGFNESDPAKDNPTFRTYLGLTPGPVGPGLPADANPERVRKVVEALPKMEARAREQVERSLHEMYKEKELVGGGALPSGATKYSKDKATFLDEIRQQFKLVPK